MTKLMILIAALIGVATPLNAEPVSVSVPTAGLDLATSEGRAALTQRAERIAARECGDASASDLRGKQVVEECRTQIATAVQRHAAQQRMATAD